jgi:hypothetical protein
MGRLGQDGLPLPEGGKPDDILIWWLVNLSIEECDKIPISYTLRKARERPSSVPASVADGKNEDDLIGLKTKTGSIPTAPSPVVWAGMVGQGSVSLAAETAFFLFLRWHAVGQAIL